jgi:bifunctional DNA-binding transcriptional regulator/antitoxin component of YhaV-PrlF toxin-antitoxin module
MAGPAAALSVPAGVVYGIGRIDASGRVTDRAVACALGWREGDRLTLTASPGILTARRDPGGMVTAPARACLAIPAVLRRRCGLRAGDRVLLAAVPGQNMLAAFSFAVVDQTLRAHGTFPYAPGGEP